MPNLRRHQSRGTAPAPQLAAMPRCPMTGVLIEPGKGVYIVGFNPETGVTKSFYVHTGALFYERSVYLATQGFDLMELPEGGEDSLN